MVTFRPSVCPSVRLSTFEKLGRKPLMWRFYGYFTMQGHQIHSKCSSALSLHGPGLMNFILKKFTFLDLEKLWRKPLMWRFLSDYAMKGHQVQGKCSSISSLHGPSLKFELYFKEIYVCLSIRPSVNI